MAVKQHVTAVRTLLREVTEHCMCVNLTETKTHYFVTVPPGYRVDAVRVSKGAGKAIALRRMLVVLEREWKAVQL